MRVINHLVYSSTASEEHKPALMESILEASVRNNKKVEVTGLLLYRFGHFIQLLEGEINDVTSVYNRVSKDKRHSKIQIISQFQTNSRLFATWNMGCIRNKDVVAKISQHLLSLLTNPLPPSQENKNQIIELFSKINSNDIT